MAKLRLSSINKAFGGVDAVKDFNLTVNDGEFLVLLGPSGSGKTTVLRMVAGLETPTTGEIFIDDVLVNGKLPKERDVAMVFQNYALYPHLSAYDNISMPLKSKKLSAEEIDKRIKETAEVLQIGHVLTRKPGQLSGGEQQRVAVARAVVRSPKVFLFDEPLSNLDAKLRVTARGFLKRLQKDLKVTTVYVTHDQAEAMTMADRMVVMNHGVLQQISEPDRVYREPANMFVASFVGSPPINLVPGAIVKADGSAKFVAKGNIFEVPVSSDAPQSEEVYLGVRPEDVVVHAKPPKGGWTARVYLQEPMGSVQFLTLDVNGTKIVSQTQPNLSVSLNQTVGFSIQHEGVHVFDAKDGRRMD
ncbi:MAG: ABC transporter ATP-binding protein [Nitrososphaerota archaeon]|nr:ABC transporter ATP-binding protein [Nitrososphaerota archaeon]